MLWSSQLKRFRHAKKVFDVTYLDLHQENVSIWNDYSHALWQSCLALRINKTAPWQFLCKPFISLSVSLSSVCLSVCLSVSLAPPPLTPVYFTLFSSLSRSAPLLCPWLTLTFRVSHSFRVSLLTPLSNCVPPSVCTTLRLSSIIDINCCAGCSFCGVFSS